MARSVFYLAFVFPVLTGLFLWMALPGPAGPTFAGLAAGPAASSSMVDPRVLADTADGRTAHFLVMMLAQADASRAAARAPDREARVPGVVGALQQAAATQLPLRAELEARSIPYRAFWLVNAIATEGDRALVDALAARPDVLAIEADRSFRVPLEPRETTAPSLAAGVEWNIDWVKAPDLWTLGYRGQGIVYANADTGVQWDHTALKPHYRGWNGASVDHNYNWWDAVRDGSLGSNPCGYASATPCDDYGHGTHTMGTGIGDDGAGNQIGVAPGAKWIACRNMNNGVGRPSLYIACLQFLVAPTNLSGGSPDPSRHADVISNSYGCPIGPPPGEECVTNSLLAAVNNVRAAGIFVAVSAGNSGRACSTVQDPPAFYGPVTTVGALAYQSNNIASFSSRGPVTADGSNRRKPDIVAPGVGVRSAYPNNLYASFQGTSMAAPHVAGAVALLWSAYPALRGNVNLTEAILYQTALPLTTSQSCGGDTASQVPNNVYGYGALDALAAFQRLQSAPAAVRGHVAMEGRAATPPAQSYVMTVTLSVLQPGLDTTAISTTASTDALGYFTATGLYTGAWDPRAKGSHTLSRKLGGVALSSGSNSLDWVARGALPEGDADGNNSVGILDFSLLRSSFGACSAAAGFDPRVDFNNSGCTTILDFSLLRTNFGRSGE